MVSNPGNSWYNIILLDDKLLRYLYDTMAACRGVHGFYVLWNVKLGILFYFDSAGSCDHIGGLDVVIYKFDCGKVLLPDYRKDTKTYEEVENTLKVKNYKAVHPDAGDKYLLGDAFFTVVSPAGKFDSDVPCKNCLGR